MIHVTLPQFTKHSGNLESASENALFGGLDDPYHWISKRNRTPTPKTKAEGRRGGNREWATQHNRARFEKAVPIFVGFMETEA